MVNHIVLWNLKDELSETEKKEAALRIKKELEAVKDQVDGVVSLKVVIDGLSSGNRDIALISVFETEEALKTYQVSPAHVKAGGYVGTVTANRTCFDYEDTK